MKCNKETIMVEKAKKKTKENGNKMILKNDDLL